VFSPALPRHCCPTHFFKAPFTVIVTDCGGEMVSQKIWRNDGRLSISQLMFLVGEMNSPLVAVCKGSVGVVTAGVPEGVAGAVEDAVG
jgi:hypothetical protein